MAREITVKDIRMFSECPVRWYINSKKKNKRDYTTALKDISTFFFCKLMSANKITKGMLLSRIESIKPKKYKIRNVRKWMLTLMKKFKDEKLNIRCINLPFQVILNGVKIVDKIDIIRKSTYGVDIIMFDYSEKVDVKKLENDPSFLIYILGLSDIFKESVNSINIYNVPNGKLVDVSRRTDLMCDQMDELKSILHNIIKLDITPKISLGCKHCDVQEDCFRSYYELEGELNG